MTGDPDDLDSRDSRDGRDVDRSGEVRPDESPRERLDRNFGDLLQELRVAQTGVQILFAFLLTLPFATGFGKTLPRDRAVYVVTLLAAAAAAALLIAPVSYHRLVFRQDRKDELVRTASYLAVAGLTCLMVAILGAVFVVMDVVVGLAAAIAAAAGVGLLCLVFWYAMPLRGRRPTLPVRDRHSTPPS
jgi:O-antigen/teichoic acid export membrane protein